jgi:hypothetical protein
MFVGMTTQRGMTLKEPGTKDSAYFVPTSLAKKKVLLQ